jgi:hypothetical protein
LASADDFGGRVADAFAVFIDWAWARKGGVKAGLIVEEV